MRSKLIAGALAAALALPALAQSSVVDERKSRSPMSTVAMNALYGGAAGAVVGAGVALINEGDDWGRDLMLGTGLGVVAGAIVGGVLAYRDSGSGADRVAMVDGLGTPEREKDRQRKMVRVAAYTFRW